MAVPYWQFRGRLGEQEGSVRLSVVIPVHNGGDDLRCGLAALAASTRPPDEVIVVDDGSADGSGEVARQHGARVIRLDGPPHGPAYARNRGAEAAQGDVLLFLDADVAVHPDTLARIEQYLVENPTVVALFGSYDDSPPAPGLVSRYKNLLHHYVHQHSRQEASTFWAGCGAIRRQVFTAVGGFDEGYGRPAIEDIALGARLREAGHTVWLCPDVQVAHLKKWSLHSLLRSDIFDRAVPWARLIAKQGRLPGDLNLNVGSRLSAVAAWCVVLCLALLLVSPWAAVGALLALAVVAALNADLYCFFARRGGAGFAVGGAALHFLYLLYSSLVFVLIVGPTWLARRGPLLLLLAALLNGLAWSVILPPFHAPDENVHFYYVQIIARFHALQPDPGLWNALEVGRLWRLAGLQAVRWHPNPLDLSDRAGIAAQIAELSDPALQWTYRYNDERWFAHLRRFMSFHPPLYYALAGGVHRGLEGHDVRVRLLGGRWLSVLLGLVTVALAVRAGRTLWPGRSGERLLLGVLVGFQPMAAFCAAILNNQALEIPLFSAFLVLSLEVIRRGMSLWRSLALGLVVGLGLLTKISFLCALPLLALLAAWNLAHSMQQKGSAGRVLWLWLLLAVLPVLLAGWWYRGAVLSGGDTLVSLYGAIHEQAGVRLLPYLLHYGWVTIYRSVLAMYWGNFGWLDTPLPEWLTGLLSGLTLFAVAMAGVWLIRRIVRRQPGPAAGMFFLGCATLATVAFYTYLDYRMARDLGGQFGIQGRYYLPPLVGQMAWLGLGLTWPLPARLRRGGMWLLGAGMVVLDLYALFGVVAPRYYGTRDLATLLERAAVIPPVSAPTLAVACATLLTLTAALLAALWGATAQAAPSTASRR